MCMVPLGCVCRVAERVTYVVPRLSVDIWLKFAWLYGYLLCFPTCGQGDVQRTGSRVGTSTESACDSRLSAEPSLPDMLLDLLKDSCVGDETQQVE